MITENDKLSDLISKNIDLLPVVHRLGLSTQIGEKTIHEVCTLHKKDLKFILGILNTYSSADYLPNPENVELTQLIEFLSKTHEFHKHTTIPRLYASLEQLKKLLPNEKRLIIIENFLNKYIAKLLAHIDFEEKEIFPLAGKKFNQEEKSQSPNLKKLCKQHTNVENELSDFKIILIRHIPADADMELIHDLLHTLAHFENEQRDHARFEDKILIPKLFALQSN